MPVEFVLCVGACMVAAFLLTALLCCLRVSRRLQVSYGTVIAGTCITTLLAIFLFSGGECFSPSFWSPDHHKDPDWPFSFARIIGFIAVICTLPALGVVDYFQRRDRKLIRGIQQVLNSGRAILRGWCRRRLGAKCNANPSIQIRR
jgi:hypothetical protein